MKNRPLSQKHPSPFKAVLPAAILILLGTAQMTQASITWVASDDGTDLTLTTSGGSLAYVAVSSIPGNAASVYNSGSNTLGSDGSGTSGGSTVTIIEDAGSFSGADPWIAATGSVGTNETGDIFIFQVTDLILAPGAPLSGTISPTASVVFPGFTVASAFGTSLDSAPVVLWTSTSSGDTISITAVPEPSTSGALAIGIVSILFRRIRK